MAGAWLASEHFAGTMRMMHGTYHLRPMPPQVIFQKATAFLLNSIPIFSATK
jgi:hypothetical protein